MDSMSIFACTAHQHSRWENWSIMHLVLIELMSCLALNRYVSIWMIYLNYAPKGRIRYDPIFFNWHFNQFSSLLVHNSFGLMPICVAYLRLWVVLIWSHTECSKVDFFSISNISRYMHVYWYPFATCKSVLNAWICPFSNTLEITIWIIKTTTIKFRNKLPGSQYTLTLKLFE